MSTDNTVSSAVLDHPLWATFEPMLRAAGESATQSFEAVQKFATSDKSIRDHLNENQTEEFAALIQKLNKAKEAMLKIAEARDNYVKEYIRDQKSKRGENSEAEQTATAVHKANVSAYKTLRKSFSDILDLQKIDAAPYLNSLPAVVGTRRASTESSGERRAYVGGHVYTVNGEPQSGSLRKISDANGWDWDDVSAAFFSAAGTEVLKDLDFGTVTTFHIEDTDNKKHEIVATRVNLRKSESESEDDKSSAVAE